MRVADAMTYCPQMPRFAAAAALLALVLAPCSPAAATWMHCSALGTDTAGPFAVETTTADVGAVEPARLAQLKQSLLAYVAKADPDAHAPAVTCYTFDDQVAATSHYSQMLGATARRLGWEHMTVLQPEDWLASRDIVADPARP
jgi:hypothetical protein